jgi:rhodanese-related sulfurtransferase
MRATNVNVSAKGRGSARPRQTTLLRSRLQNNGRPSSTRGRLVFAKAEENKDNGGEGKNALLEAFEQYKGDKKGERSGGMKLPKVDLKTPSFELTKNVWKKVDTEWSVARKSLADFGLESVSSYNASNMVKDGKAVIVDVRTKQAYEIEHVEPSMSLPLYVRAKGGEGSLAKKVFLGSKTTRKNEDFAADAKALLGDEQRTIIVACSTGGDLANNSNGNGSGNGNQRDQNNGNGNGNGNSNSNGNSNGNQRDQNSGNGNGNGSGGRVCPRDMQKCPGGGAVGRDPFNNCRFRSCGGW